jgi:phosphatidylserine decarboxylase
MPFARHATRELAIALGVLAALLLVVLVGGLLALDDWRWPVLFALPIALAIVLVPMPFRAPERTVPRGEQRVVAPADGTIFDIGEVDGPDGIDEPCVRVGIMISVFDPHVVRAPCSGTVERVVRAKGKYHSMLKPQIVSANNASTTTLIANAAGTEATIAVRQFAGPVLKHVICELREGDEVERGQIFGMLKFGSRVEIFVPRSASFNLRAKLGASMEGGRSVLGTLEPTPDPEPETADDEASPAEAVADPETALPVADEGADAPEAEDAASAESTPPTRLPESAFDSETDQDATPPTGTAAVADADAEVTATDPDLFISDNALWMSAFGVDPQDTLSNNLNQNARVSISENFSSPRARRAALSRGSTIASR